MAFRRKRMVRRRRKGPETYTVFQCRDFVNIYGTMNCTDPLNAALTIWVPTPSVGATDVTTAGGVIGTKGHSLVGMKFQAEHQIDPALFQDDGCDPHPNDLAFNLTIWEALVVLPLAVGSKTLPAYLPTLPSAQSSFDVADRVLWKRLSYLPIWGLNTTGGIFPQLEGTWRDTAAGPQTVKTKCFIDDRHGLFYVRSFVHDVFLQESIACVMNVQMDFWMKLWYHTRTG